MLGVVSVTSTDMTAARCAAARYRAHFNAWLNGTGLAALLYESQRSSRPPVTVFGQDVGLGPQYATCFQSWMQEAVGVSLVKACDGPHGARFTSGMLGSVWMDVSLTGTLPDGTSKTKRVRVALLPTGTPRLASNTSALRVVDGEVEEVQVEKPADDADFWLLTTGESVQKNELYPVHVLNDSTQYTLVLDPTLDLERTF